ncbi:MAG TPA: hypothetical protein VD931_07150 [Baekduia sp.]|nr:hypothetical protein [Baekduia sp.]
MVGQRLALGLNERGTPPAAPAIEVVPVVAVGLPMTRRREAPERFDAVRDALWDVVEELAGLQIWAVDEASRLRVTDATSLRDPRLRSR